MTGSVSRWVSHQIGRERALGLISEHLESSPPLDQNFSQSFVVICLQDARLRPTSECAIVLYNE